MVIQIHISLINVLVLIMRIGKILKIPLIWPLDKNLSLPNISFLVHNSFYLVTAKNLKESSVSIVKTANDGRQKKTIFLVQEFL